MGCRKGLKKESTTIFLQKEKLKMTRINLKKQRLNASSKDSA
jgi:hypothetical protein